MLSGVFNNVMPNAQTFLQAVLRNMFAAARRGIAFNAMSTYVDFLAKDLTYFDPGEVFRFCKEELSPLVCLRHDYTVKPNVVPYEFAMYVYKCGAIAPRRRKAPHTRRAAK
jgi:hypothetical protein